MEIGKYTGVDDRGLARLVVEGDNMNTAGTNTASINVNAGDVVRIECSTTLEDGANVVFVLDFTPEAEPTLY